MKKNILFVLLLLSTFSLLMGCSHAKPANDPDAKQETGTPVTLTSVSNGPLTESVELNAVSAFLLKSYVKSSANGYIIASFIQPGQYVSRGTKLFILRTKEAQNLGNAISRADSSFHFSGQIVIRASGSGYITTLNYRAGDYVTDSEQLAVISNQKSFAFMLELPYELRTLLAANKNLTVKLPDGTVLSGRVSGTMPTVDLSSQTLPVIIKVSSGRSIPENLIGKISLIKKIKRQAVSLPREAILTNDTQSEFWVMKMINPTTAIKVPVQTGMITHDRVEILSPQFSSTDRIILTGNYGLPNSAKVVITSGAF